jgi:CheY-like chemotaxis protein
MKASPKRILLVENDPHVLDSTSYNLQTAGYQVVTAGSPEEALNRLCCEIIHLAIVDIRLQHEDRPDDCSGLDVVRELPAYIPCVVYSGYVAAEDIQPLVGRGKGRVEILWKHVPQASSRLVEIVEELFASEVRVNFNLGIRGTLDIESVAARIETLPPSNVPQPSADDVIQVVQALFHDAVGIHVTPLLSPRRAPTFTQTGSIIVQARPQFKNAWGTPVVVKFSAQDEIAREASNYQIIKPFLGGHRLAVLERQAYSRQIGGLVYSLIGAGDWEAIRTFSEVFLDEDTETVTGLLDQFFGQTFRALFADARRETINLTATYTEALRLTPKKLRTALEGFHPEAVSEPYVRFKELQGSYINPVMWALPRGSFRHLEVVSRRCLCHGDLHGQNILVDADGHFWLIDFARVAESHALRDFAELETDIKFNLLPVV